MTGASRGLGRGDGDRARRGRRRRRAARERAAGRGHGRRALPATSGRRTRSSPPISPIARRRDRIVAEAHRARSAGSTSSSTTPGIIRRQPAAEHDDEIWDAVIEVNLSSVFRLCRAAGAHMIERGEGGKIVNVASLLSFQGGITVPGYAAAKGGVDAADQGARQRVGARTASTSTRSRRATWRPTTPTALRERRRAAAGRSPNASRPAGGARRRISPAPRSFSRLGASDYVHGHVLVVDGGWMGR